MCSQGGSTDGEPSYAPKYAKIGDSGYFSKDRRQKNSDGTTTIISKEKSWSLQDGYNGYALLVIKVKGLNATWVEKWTIKPSGERVKLQAVYSDRLGGSVTLTSK